MIDKWDHRFLALAGNIADWSKDPSTRVGAVLVNDLRQVIGMGYNGFPRGVDDLPSRYADRDWKYHFTQHAEANAVLQAVASPRDATAYVTHHPCANCAGMLIQAGVRRIVTTTPDAGLAERFERSFEVARFMCTEAGVKLVCTP